MLISSTLKNWYLKNKRELPWRFSKNPYYIWVSEVILQQTRVNQGLSYYSNFINQFPDIKSLANAKQDDVYKLWQGLGYYSRARNLQEGAKYVLQNYGGLLPDSYEELLKIKGIGDYTASAIASIAFNKAHAAVDGNVNRVITRIFGITEDISSAAGKQKIRQIAENIIDKKNPGEFNQAMMEFGALQCVPKNPDCDICPLKSSCYAKEHGMIDLLPIKNKKNKVTTRYFYYLFMVYKNEFIFIKQRTGKDIWNGLYEFPLVETDKKHTIQSLSLLKEWKNLFGDIPIYIDTKKHHFKHKLSHQTIEAELIHISTENLNPAWAEQFIMIHYNNLSNYPVSRLVEKLVQSVDL